MKNTKVLADDEAIAVLDEEEAKADEDDSSRKTNAKSELASTGGSYYQISFQAVNKTFYLKVNATNNGVCLGTAADDQTTRWLSTVQEPRLFPVTAFNCTLKSDSAQLFLNLTDKFVPTLTTTPLMWTLNDAKEDSNYLISYTGHYLQGKPASKTVSTTTDKAATGILWNRAAHPY